MKVIEFTQADRLDPRIAELEDVYEDKARAGEYVRVGPTGGNGVAYIERAYLKRVQAEQAEQEAISFIMARQAARKCLAPGTVRDTVDAAFKAISNLRRGFVEPAEVRMHPALWDEVRAIPPRAVGMTYADGSRLFGVPVTLDYTMPLDKVQVSTAEQVTTRAVR